jgi:IS30 family transposase
LFRRYAGRFKAAVFQEEQGTMRIFKHLTWSDRLKIEALALAKNTPRAIADTIRVHVSTIYRELERGQYEHKNTDWTFTTRYAPEIAEQKYRANLAAKGAPLKIGSDYELAEFIEKKIVEDKYSPAAVLGEIKNKGLEFKTTICTGTVYSYIDKGVFLNLTNKHLPIKSTRKRTYRHVRPKRPPKGESIEKRPQEINDRKTFGHWEMDTVKGKRDTKKVILVLTERLSRNEVQIPMSSGTAENAVNALNGLERKYGEMFPHVFKTITIDNGSEFADVEGMEKSIFGDGKRTKIYNCHPYSSWERGSNENQNKLIRRHIPKGTPIENYTDEEIQGIENWINNYPRKIFKWRSSAEVFAESVTCPEFSG